MALRGIPMIVAKEILEKYGMEKVVILYKTKDGHVGRTFHGLTKVGRQGHAMPPGEPSDVLKDIWEVLDVFDEDDLQPAGND